MNVRDMTSNLPSRDELMSILGVQARQSSAESVLSSFGIFGAGMMIGAVLALLFAPKSGQEIRQDLGQRMNDMRADLEKRAGEATKTAASAASSARPQA